MEQEKIILDKVRSFIANRKQIIKESYSDGNNDALISREEYVHKWNELTSLELHISKIIDSNTPPSVAPTEERISIEEAKNKVAEEMGWRDFDGLIKYYVKGDNFEGLIHQYEKVLSILGISTNREGWVKVEEMEELVIWLRINDFKYNRDHNIWLDGSRREQFTFKELYELFKTSK